MEGTLEIFYNDGSKRITHLHSSFFDTICMGTSVITAKDKAEGLRIDSGASSYKLFRGDKEL